MQATLEIDTCARSLCEVTVRDVTVREVTVRRWDSAKPALPGVQIGGWPFVLRVEAGDWRRP